MSGPAALYTDVQSGNVLDPCSGVSELCKKFRRRLLSRMHTCCQECRGVLRRADLSQPNTLSVTARARAHRCLVGSARADSI